MFKKITFLLISFSLIASMAYAGNIDKSSKSNSEVRPVKHNKTVSTSANVQTIHSFKKTTGVIDTLNHELNYNTSFTFSPGDIMVKWYEAPTDLKLKGAGIDFYNYDEIDENASVEIKVVKLNYGTEKVLGTASATYLGYYEGSDATPYGRSPFMDDETTVGDWVDVNGEGETYGEDLWSDGGLGAPVPQSQIDFTAGVYYFIDFEELLGFAPEIAAGERFAIVVKNTTPADAAQPDLWILANGDGVYPCFKWYQEGRLQTDSQADGFDAGWWLRTGYTWDIGAVVELLGDIAPDISGITAVPTTLSTDPQTVEATITDVNPSGGNAGVAVAKLQYSVDDGTTWSEVDMTANGDLYSADIPGQEPGTTIMYQIYAEDVEGNGITSGALSYFIFKQVNNTLVLFNGTSTVGGYPNAYYFGIDDFANYAVADFPHDSWAYGEATADLLNLYDNIIEITANNSGPAYIYNDIIAAWLAADGTRNYMLIGDEWLGVQSGWENMAHTEGDFIYDVLGITFEYNDVNYDGSDVTTPSVVMPVQGSLLGGPLYDLWQATAGADTMLYDPAGEISGANFLDGADLTDDVEVDMKGIGLDGTEYNIGFHRTLANGNKVVVLLYDALSVNSSPEYYWFGFSASAPQVQALDYFGIVVGVEEESLNPTEFALAQNYPNPFNPTTTISFSLAQKSDVNLKVYNLLGQEVMTLVNGVQNAGVHTVDFNASQLSSGVYFYTISAGDFVSTKKMILLK